MVDKPWLIYPLVTEIGALPGGQCVDKVLSTRLFRAYGPDRYTGDIKAALASQVKLRSESEYRPATLEEIESILNDQQPKSARDLQAVVLEELSVVQGKINADDVESWRGFFDDKGVPFDEERCRDHLLGLLRQGSAGIHLDPEAHVAGDKEVDITCSVGQIRIPIEIKGQWNRDVWRGVESQLDRLYTTDWRAQGVGIYLVLWFGNHCSPRKRVVGFDNFRPSTPSEFKDALVQRTSAARDGRIAIFVMDVERRKVA